MLVTNIDIDRTRTIWQDRFNNMQTNSVYIGNIHWIFNKVWEKSRSIAESSVNILDTRVNSMGDFNNQILV